MNDRALDQQWTKLHGALRDVLSRFGIEDPYGDGDYWVVDDNWGDPSQKVEISRASFLTPTLITEIKEALRAYPSWRVLLQINEEVAGSPAFKAGFTVRHDSVETVGITEP